MKSVPVHETDVLKMFQEMHSQSNEAFIGMSTFVTQ